MSKQKKKKMEMARCPHCKAEIDHLDVRVKSETIYELSASGESETVDSWNISGEDVYSCPECSEILFRDTGLESAREKAEEFLKSGTGLGLDYTRTEELREEAVANIEELHDEYMTTHPRTEHEAITMSIDKWENVLSIFSVLNYNLDGESCGLCAFFNGTAGGCDSCPLRSCGEAGDSYAEIKMLLWQAETRIEKFLKTLETIKSNHEASLGTTRGKPE